MLEVIINNIATSLDDGEISVLVGFDGWGMSPLHRLSERGPLQHGATDRGYRLDPRVGNLILQFRETELSNMYDRRRSLLSLFRPQNDPSLRWTLPNGDIRQIDCHYLSDMSLPWSSEKWAAQKIAVSLISPDPTFYDPEVKDLSFTTGGGGVGMGIPWEIPWEVGASSIDKTAQVVYTGDFLTYPQIRIYGPVTSPILTNESTGEKLDFTGTTISSGQYYFIDCNYGVKSVVDHTGANQVSKLTNDSDLATFHVAADPEAPGGVNSFTLTGTGVTEITNVIMYYKIRYLGI